MEAAAALADLEAARRRRSQVEKRKAVEAAATRRLNLFQATTAWKRGLVAELDSRGLDAPLNISSVHRGFVSMHNLLESVGPPTPGLPKKVIKPRVDNSSSGGETDGEEEDKIRTVKVEVHSP